MALGGQKVYAVVGGFHMMKLSGMDTLAIPEEEVVETAQELKGLWRRGNLYRSLYRKYCIQDSEKRTWRNGTCTLEQVKRWYFK